MGPISKVEEFLTAIEKNDFAKAESFLSKTFKVTGVGPEALNAKDYLNVHRAFNKGMPDFKFNYKIEHEKNKVVEVKVRITGTHTKDMPAPIPGLKNISTTNKPVNMPEETVKFTVRDNKIEKLHLESVPGGGLPGLLKQLGVEMPVETHHEH